MIVILNGFFIFFDFLIYGWFFFVIVVFFIMFWMFYNVIVWIKSKLFFGCKGNFFYIGSIFFV